MNFRWIKSFVPRGLYGRAALILILPIVVVQIVVSTVFLQRHFEGVTEQMTRSLSLEISYILGEVNAAPDLASAQLAAETLSRPLALRAELPASQPTQNARAFYDLSGRVMVRTLSSNISQIVAVDFTSQRGQVRAAFSTDHGEMRLEFARGRVSASNPHQLLVWMIFTGLLMTGIAYLFLRNQLRPIRKLAEAATNFGKGAPTDYRPRGAAEVRQAGNAFLEMRARIERQIDQRTLMLSGVSHDLRTPLTRLKLGLSMIEDGEGIEELRRDVGDMEDLLDSFLDYARGQATGDHTDADPVALARTAVENARRSGGEVEFLAVSQDVKVSLRPAAVTRALGNLIGNALRYGNRARVSIDVYDRAVRFRVEDDGPGIPEGEREAALRAFSRLEPARNQDKGTGVGLGLTITADIARSHGGTLRLGTSSALGGLCADLVIPR